MALSTSRLKGVIKTLTLSFLPVGWPDSSPLSPSQKADIDAKIRRGSSAIFVVVLLILR